MDAFMKDLLCFGWLQPSATESLFAAAPRLADRARLLQIRHISYDFYPGGRHEMLNEINRDEVRSNLLGWISGVLAATPQLAV